MEFLGVGYQEVLVILAVMLVVVGPERLPAMAYQIGRAVRTLQQYARAVRDEFKDEFDYLDEQMKVVKGGVDDLNRTMREGEREFRRDLDAIAPAELTGDQPPSNVVPFGAPAQPGSSSTIVVDGQPVTTNFGTEPNGSAPAEPEPAAEPGSEKPAEPLVF